MSVNSSHHVSSQALACYEIPDSKGTNHWNSLPNEVIYRIFNFILSGKSETPSPNALLRLIRLNCKTVCRISFASKGFSSCISTHSNEIGRIANINPKNWKRELEVNRPNIFSIRASHYDLQLAKETISYWNKLGAKQISQNKGWISVKNQKDMVDNGFRRAAELYAYGLLSYEQIIDLISSLPDEIKQSGCSHVCYKLVEMNLSPLVIHLIQQGYITDHDILIEIIKKILSNIRSLNDDFDQDVITFIHYEIIHEDLSKMFPYTTHEFHSVLDHALERGFFRDDIELIQKFIEKNSPEDSVELEKSLGERAWLKNIFFKNLVKRHLFDQALEFGKTFEVEFTTMAIHLIQEKQYVM